jgi:diguanylate cyclase (GGDEF)-like protein
VLKGSPDVEVSMELYDKLTGLYNYEGFLLKVKDILERGTREDYILIRFDIKNFKLVNDIFGMEAGDRLLLRISSALRNLDLPDAIYCRVECDRFGVFIPERYEDEVVELLVSTPFFADYNENYQIYIYMGIYNVCDKSIPVSMMSDRANIALGTVKANRFVRIAVYDESMYNDIVQECELSTELTRAIENGEIKPYLQPQVTADGKLMGAEVLVRWNHPEKGLLNPGVFLPVFEKNYKIVDIDKYVWELACMMIRRWSDERKEKICLSINISPRDFESIDVYGTLMGLVNKYHIEQEQLRVEITESSIMQNPEKQIELIGRLRLAKFYVEMDDFGSGYSSLGMLKDIHLDAIKLDMRFLSSGVDGERGRKIIDMTVRLLKELNMTVIAEGVETKEEVDYLRQVGVDVFQGFYYSRPIPVDEFEEKYMNQARIFERPKNMMQGQVNHAKVG